MKCIKKKEKIERIDDSTAELRVNSQGWRYISKLEWKEKVRDVKVEKNK